MAKQTIASDLHIMTKPTGSACNLNCEYCFFLKKEELYPGSNFRMSDEVHEAFIKQLFEHHRHLPQVIIPWQGGEPTLMGIDFFKRSLELQNKYAVAGTQIQNTFQTNGILLNDSWCEFFYKNNFLIGLSLDGPEEFHNTYRKDKGGHGTFDQVIRAVRLLQKHNVNFNILCTVNNKNADHPLEIYHFFKDELGIRYIQFIPIVERDNASRNQKNIKVTERSVSPDAYGKFLISIFDEWVKKDVGTIFVPFFDAVLASYVYGQSSVCALSPTCGNALALVHTGDVYSCDHFVEPRYLLGNITKTSLTKLASSKKQLSFGNTKRDSLPRYCRECEFVFTCHGECPKNRILKTPDGEPGLNWLCCGLKDFFAHTKQPMQIMTNLLKNGRFPDEIMNLTEEEKTI